SKWISPTDIKIKTNKQLEKLIHQKESEFAQSSSRSLPPSSSYREESSVDKSYPHDKSYSYDDSDHQRQRYRYETGGDDDEETEERSIRSQPPPSSQPTISHDEDRGSADVW